MDYKSAALGIAGMVAVSAYADRPDGILDSDILPYTSLGEDLKVSLAKLMKGQRIDGS